VSTGFKYVFLGLSVTSSWGNGHATTYRSLIKNLAARGHEVTFLERDLPFYAENRDLPQPPYARTHIYGSMEELEDRYSAEIRSADVVVVGSYVPEGVRVGALAQNLAPGRAVFYDIDTPVTLTQLAKGESDYIARDQISRYAMYLSFTGGPILKALERTFGSPCARVLFCSVDPDLYFPEPTAPTWDLGYLGTYSEDRQPGLERLLVEPARAWREGRFVVAGPQYPEHVTWPDNVARPSHVPPGEHRRFYNTQRFTLNITRAPMIAAGWSPSVRLFEAAACGTPIISDPWPGLDEILVPGQELLVAESGADTLRFVRELSDEERSAIGDRARRRILAEHTSMHRAETLERYTLDLFERHSRRARAAASRGRTRAGTSTM
jgi:spore maturation protein CgeB